MDSWGLILIYTKNALVLRKVETAPWDTPCAEAYIAGIKALHGIIAPSTEASWEKDKVRYRKEEADQNALHCNYCHK